MEIPSLRVVLVRPEEAGNVGAAARVLRNFGMNHLVLVSPRAARPAEAIKWARGAEDLLEGADIVEDLATAVAPCTEVWGATRRRGRGRGTYLSPREAAERSAPLLAEGTSIAWVFGPESRGLRTEELDHCTARVTIPTGPRQESLNLAQAVAVCCYESFVASRETGVPRARRTPATHGERKALYDHLETALGSIGFIEPHTASARMRVLRRILERSAPTPEEVRFLRGIARQTAWAGEKRNLEDQGQGSEAEER
jgi:tRNA/rRNA methyltransferase